MPKMKPSDRDPIFAAIERSRQAEADFFAEEGEGAHFEHLGEIASSEFRAMISMTPTSVAGAAALLRWIEERAKPYGKDENALFANHSEETRDISRDLLTRIASVLEARE